MADPQVAAAAVLSSTAKGTYANPHPPLPEVPVTLTKTIPSVPPPGVYHKPRPGKIGPHNPSLDMQRANDPNNIAPGIAAVHDFDPVTGKAVGKPRFKAGGKMWDTEAQAKAVLAGKDPHEVAGSAPAATATGPSGEAMTAAQQNEARAKAAAAAKK